MRFPRNIIPILVFALPAAGLLTAAAPAPVSSKSTGKPSPPRAAPAAAPDTFQRDAAPLVQKYCVTCHGGSSPTAGISLSGYHDTTAVVKARDVWDKVAQNVRDGNMPPAGVPHPTAPERQ